MARRYSPEQEAQMRAMNIPLGANVTFIEMGPGRPPRTTGGWTDEQIQAKTLVEIDALITQNEKAAQGLREALKGQEDRLMSLRMVRQRRIDLG
jgi:hypothetical protein